MIDRGKSGGFTLMETVVGVLVGVVMVSAIAVLGGSLIRHRVSADSSSAATSLAQRQLEQLRARPTPAAAGHYGPFSVTEGGDALIGAPYEVRWTVTDDVPWTGAKRIDVEVSHESNRFARTALSTYYLVPTGGGGGATPAPGVTPTGPLPLPTIVPTPTPKKGKGRGRS